MIINDQWFFEGLLTRNGSLDLEPPSDKAGRKKAFDILAAAALPGKKLFLLDSKNRNIH